MDCGCPKPVAGAPWVESLLETLGEEELLDVKVKNSGEVFQFGDGEPKSAKKKICILTYHEQEAVMGECCRG